MSFFLFLVSIWCLLWLISRILFKEALASHVTKARVAAAIAFTFIGVTHLVTPEKLVYMVENILPFPYELVIVSGILEILGGIGLLFPWSQRMAGIGLIMLLLAVFPGNINVAVNNLPAPGGLPSEPWYIWSRLAFQPIFIYWVWRCAVSRKDRTQIKHAHLEN